MKNSNVSNGVLQKMEVRCVICRMDSMGFECWIHTEFALDSFSIECTMDRSLRKVLAMLAGVMGGLFP
jgi:hypothetical protein